MKIHFMIQFLISAVLGAFAYLFYELNLIPAAGVFGAICALVGISAFCNGTWPNNIRKKYVWNIVLDILVYIPVVVILLDGFLILVNNVPIADKIFNIIPETRIAVKTLIIELGKLFKSQPELVQLSGNIKWSYIFLVANLIWCSYKVWSSYGKKFMIASGLTILAIVCCCCFWPSTVQWRAICIAGVLFLSGLTWYQIRKHWNCPAIA